MLRHIVLMQFAPGIDPKKADEAVTRFFALREQTGEMRTIEYGENVSAEGMDQGFSHCFLIDFADEKARDRYLNHPAHQDFLAYVMPFLANGLVVDFKPQSALQKAA